MSHSDGGPENPFAAPSSELTPPSTPGAYRDYSQVPWYRKSSINSIFVLLGLCCGPFILAVCIILLTGDVYYNKKDANGDLKRWSTANKVVAVIILVFQIAAIGYNVFSLVAPVGGMP